MLVTVNVTQEHIDKGVCGHPRACAISQAVMDMVKPDTLVTTGLCTVNLDESYSGFHYNSQFIMWFDENKSKVSPISFDLDIPVEYLKVSEPPARPSQEVEIQIEERELVCV